MTRNLLFGTLFSAALAVGVAAQSGSTGSGATSQGGTRAQEQQSQVTVTGCLQNADMKGSGATAGTSGSGTTGSGSQTAKSGSGDAEFMLTNATMAKTSATSSSGSGTGTATSGTSGAAGTTSAMNRFVLVGGNQQNLRQYLNSQVEVQGRLDQGKGTTGSAAGSATAGAPSSSGMSDIAKLHVASVRQIATTCTER